MVSVSRTKWLLSMSHIIKTNPSLVRPSQDYLKGDTLDFIKQNFEAGNLEKLPPAPIVRKDENGGYIAIDGHNLLAFYSLRNMECYVCVAESKDDKIEGDSEMIQKRNTDLFEKYDSALNEANSLKEKGIVTIKDLCNSAGLSLEFR